ncbi:MAG: hypothetical protein K2Y37_19445 [Pirellulales bacterium]|nr:hypothetical protein [Pirellulales bacterium]
MAIARPHPLFEGIPSGACFYFAHSYAVNCEEPGDVLASTTYGQTYASAVARDNLVGVQFHPEKSHDLGARLLRNFVNWSGDSGV